MKKFFIIAAATLLLVSASSCGVNNASSTNGVKLSKEEVLSEADELFSYAASDYEGVTDYGRLAEEAAEVVANTGILSASEQESVADIADLSTTLNSWKANAIACAAAYCNGFKATYPDGGEITKIGCIIQLQEGEAYMMYAITATKDGTDTNYYSTARFADSSIESVLSARPDMFYAAQPLDESYDALVHGNITLNLEEVLSAAEETTAEESATGVAAVETTVNEQ